MKRPNDDSGTAPEPFIVCDANVVIQMTIFDSSKMFDKATYTFGKLQVNPIAIQELERWLKSKGSKFKKFGKDVIELAVKKAKSAGYSLKDLSEEEKKRKFATYQLLEEKLSVDQKGTDTSNEDKVFLALAEKNGCFLATQETTLRSLANLVIRGRLLSFEDLVLDLHGSGQLTLDNIKSGLGNLDHFQEKLRFDQKKKIMGLFAAKETV